MIKRRLLSKMRGKSSHQKRLPIQLTIILTLFTFAIVQGCTPTPEPEPVRNLSTALEVFEPPTFRCDTVDDTRFCQTISRDNLGLTVIVPKQDHHESVIIKEVPLSNKDGVLKAKVDFEINILAANFEVRDAETDEIITEFNPPLELRLNFTAEQWEDRTVEFGLDRPRFAYLVWKGDHWAEEWQEFTEDDIVKITKPGEDEKYPFSGFLYIHIEEWGDPLIGGT